METTRLIRDGYKISLSLSLSLTHTHTHTHTHTSVHTHMHTHTLCHPLSLFHTHTHTLAHTHKHTDTHTLSVSLSVYLIAFNHLRCAQYHFALCEIWAQANTFFYNTKKTQRPMG